MIRASIDIGSNSILLLIAKLGEQIEIIANEANVTGLGKGLDETGVFSQESMKDSLAVFKEYSDICHKNNVPTSQVIVTATEASRVAKNASEFYSKVKSLFGFNVQIITGEGEAYYSSMGVLVDQSIKQSSITIMDIGGASTELIHVDVKAKKILTSFSMPIGVVRMTNWRSRGIAKEEVSKVFTSYEKEIFKLKTSNLYCVAGTMTSVGNIYNGNSEFIEEEVNGLSFTYEQMQKMHTEYKDWSAKRFLEKFPFLGKRSATISAGFELASTVMQKLGVEEIYISTYGLRYGTLLAGRIEDEFIC